jgi:hypothetical protein
MSCGYERKWLYNPGNRGSLPNRDSGALPFGYQTVVVTVSPNLNRRAVVPSCRRGCRGTL